MGFAFLVANGVAWLAVGVLALRWPVQRTATVVLLMGFITLPVAFGLRTLLGFPVYHPENPLNQLAILLAFTPAVAFPAVLVAYTKYSLYVPTVMAALLGGHFLPYSWLYQTVIYLILGICVAVVPGVLMLAMRERGFAFGPLFVGSVLIIGGLVTY